MANRKNHFSPNKFGPNENNQKKVINWSRDQINAVWNEGNDCVGKIECKDPWGRIMNRDEYGQSTTKGWNIDHVKPRAVKGSHNIQNLQPLHWESNKEKDAKTNCEKGTKC